MEKQSPGSEEEKLTGRFNGWNSGGVVSKAVYRFRVSAIRRRVELIELKRITAKDVPRLTVSAVTYFDYARYLHKCKIKSGAVTWCSGDRQWPLNL